MPHPGSLFNPCALMLAALVGLSPTAAGSAPADIYYERSLMAEAGTRCGLFAPQVQSALVSAREQARGAALRAGSPPRDLQATFDRARARARAVPCDSPDIVIAAQRVRTAFEGYARLIRLDFPGDLYSWKADRSVSAQKVFWRLTQDVQQGGDQMRFGLAGRGGADSLMAVAQFSSTEAPYAARIVMRNRSQTTGAYLDSRGESLRTLPLPRRLPKSGPYEGYLADARSQAGTDLLPPGVRAGWAFRFPAQAAAAMADLDPRESIQVEFQFGSGSTRRIYVEVGDFAAGRAFLAARPG